MIQCQRTGCSANATHGLQLTIPVAGHAPFVSFTGLQLCLLHASECTPDQWVGPELEGVPGNLRQIVQRLAPGAVFNFDQATMAPISLESADWLNAERAMRGTQS